MTVLYILDWLRHLFMMLGFVYVNILTGDFEAANESWLWTKIHLTYKATKVDKVRVDWCAKLKANAVTLIGFVLTSLMLIIVIMILKNLLP